MSGVVESPYFISHEILAQRQFVLDPGHTQSVYPIWEWKPPNGLSTKAFELSAS